jgi:cytochrome c553
MASWRSGFRCSRVRMLCRRSASLMSTTRTSETMASSILRTFSAWRSSRLANWILSILVTPSTMWATCSPKPADLLVGGGRVFDGVVQQAGGDGRRVHLHLRQHLGHFERMDDVGLAGGAHLPLVMLDAELPGLADEGDIFAGAVGLDLLGAALQNACRWTVEGAIAAPHCARSRTEELMLKRLLVTAMTAVVAAGMCYADQSTAKVTIPVDKTNASNGKQMYVNYCAPCHGVDGRGQAPLPPR